MRIDWGTVAYAILILQPLAAACGLWLSLVEGRYGQRDYNATKQHNGIKRTGARYSLDQTIWRGVLQGIFLGMGLATLIDPPTPSVIFDRTSQVIFQRGMLIAATAVVMWKAVKARRYRQDVIDFWIDREGEEP